MRMQRIQSDDGNRDSKLKADAAPRNNRALPLRHRCVKLTISVKSRQPDMFSVASEAARHEHVPALVQQNDCQEGCNRDQSERHASQGCERDGSYDQGNRDMKADRCPEDLDAIQSDPMAHATLCCVYSLGDGVRKCVVYCLEG